MLKATLGGIEIEIDEDGFIQEPEKWNKEVAEDLGKIEAAYNPGEDKMSEEHWQVVDMIRNYFTEYDIAPPIRMVVKRSGVDLKRIYTLFPKGPAAGVCKIAGLPKPTGCV
ncbi:TusE/DsrC/DsvC family sulfur relay protein [Chloroflexota bacterium]